MKAAHLIRDLRMMHDSIRAAHAQRYFKAGKGGYGEGDVFLGIRVPVVRAAAKKYRDLPLHEIPTLLASEYHEIRLTGVILLAEKYSYADEHERSSIYDMYFAHMDRINNWDIVDLSAPRIVGRHLEDRPRNVLYKLVRSESLWERRIAILATLYFIKKKDFKDVLALAVILLCDTHDLIHKAVGWMLREVGKQDESVLRAFLDEHASRMPRTMLRYAVERLDIDMRNMYMNV